MEAMLTMIRTVNQDALSESVLASIGAFAFKYLRLDSVVVGPSHDRQSDLGAALEDEGIEGADSASVREIHQD